MPALPLNQHELAEAAQLKQLFIEWQHARRSQGLPASQEAAANQMEFGQSALNQYLNGKIPLNIDVAIKFSKLLGVPISAFSAALASQADDYAAAKDAMAMAQSRENDFRLVGRRITVDADQDEYIPIKKVSLTLRAGVMGFEASQEDQTDTTINLPRRFIEKNDLVPQCLLAISVKGDSMWPLMIEGDVVVINIADTKPINNELYAVNFDGEAVVKQLVREGREWYLSSMNPDPAYHRRACRGGECIIVGRVVRQEARTLMNRV
ncbi:MAG TPA: XRE family transcriptional regulator [Telluria sp.]|jgi:phage repressor protein C with HTH and peptisase S24 domain